MPITLTVPLDLPDIRMLANRMLEEGTVLIEVESTVWTAQLWPGHRPVSRIRPIWKRSWTF